MLGGYSGRLPRCCASTDAQNAPAAQRLACTVTGARIMHPLSDFAHQAFLPAGWSSTMGVVSMFTQPSAQPQRGARAGSNLLCDPAMLAPCMNPWIALPNVSPFVLPEDAASVGSFNPVAKPQHYLDTSLLPEPFLGRPDAPVVLLNLNPGWSSEDAAWHAKPEFSRLCRENLLHQQAEYPFYLLNPSIADAPGARWWRGKLGAVIKASDVATVASRMLCVEYFPYHSKSYGGGTPGVPSQVYGFELVRRALDRGAVIVLMRSRKRWFDAVPELACYRRLYCLRSAQNVSLSQRNCPDGFPEILRKLVHAL